MPILIKNESFNNIFLWKLCFIENNYFLCIVKLKKRRIMKYVIIGGVAGLSLIHISEPTRPY